MTTTTTLLPKFLALAGREGFKWGERDCMLFVADWAWVLTGKDPGKDWRGVCATEAEAMAVVEDAGGILPLLASCIEPFGWRRVEMPSPGNIVLVSVPRHETPIAGVWTAKGAALLQRRGLSVWPLPVIAAWAFQGHPPEQHPNCRCALG